MATADQIAALAQAALTRDWQRANVIAQQIRAHEVARNPASSLGRQLEKYVRQAEAAGMSDETRALKALMPAGRDDAGGLCEWRPVRRSLADVVLAPDALAVVDNLIAEHRGADDLTEAGFRPANRLMLVGPPGCGKTAAAEAIAHALERPFVVVRQDAIVGSYLGVTGANLRKVFEFLAKAPPLVLLFDEFDAVAAARGGNGDSAGAENNRSVNALLTMLDTFEGPSIILAATNRDDVIDPAVWRRFDDALYVRHPDADALWDYVSRKAAALARVAPSEVASRERWLRGIMHGLSYAEAERVVTRAAKRMVVRGEHLVEAFDAASAAERQRAEGAPSATPPAQARQPVKR